MLPSAPYRLQRRRARLSRRALPRVASVMIAVTLVLSTVGDGSSVGADHSSEEAKQAAREIQAARDRANDAAQALFDAKSAIDTLTIEIAETEVELAVVQKEANEMQTSLEASAIRRFTQSGGSSFLLLGDLSDATNQLTADVLAAVTIETANVELDDFAAVIVDVETTRSKLEQQKAQQYAAQQDFTELEQQAEAQIMQLQEVESQRVIDDAIEHELQRQREQRARRDASAAKAAAAAAANPGGGSTTSSSGGGAASAAPPSNAGRGMVCPIAGNYGFADTWGAPRSGGRSHEGVDMIAASGVPIIAVEAGTVRFSSNRLGGNAAWLTGNSGTKYYYAHLSSYTGSSGSVSRGQQIGRNGQTGNAGTPHLHFEVHPGGGRAVNPYPYVRAIC
ncbi:peptidoglycan DD-metalloendopeptidase family protein [uncultured Ilumatobacter sp.]|uniref:peptidoglycan DD-metalloendopeptidase family protein n=1 Tax=uncultured Ilumatobacter sp. TaxID=879968 RepID=UPI00374F974F